MAAVVVDFGRAHTERRALALTRADKDRILQNFPDKIAVAVPGFGPQEYPLRPHVKAFLDAVAPPTAKITFEVHGSDDDPELTSIEYTQIKVIGVSSGQFAIGETTLSYWFDADIESDGTAMNACKCPEGREGVQPTRQFRLVWDIEIEISPGIGGVFEADETDITVAGPCCCPPKPEPALPDDEEEPLEADQAGGKDRKKKKHKRRD